MSDEPDLEARLQQAVRPSLVADDADHTQIAATLRDVADRVERLEEVGL